MGKECVQCQNQFAVTDEDKVFYDKVSPVFPSTAFGTGNGKKYSIPEPTLCPLCRQQRRLAFRNERKLYHRKCDLSGKQIISTYSADKPYPVYDQDEFWSDRWDVLDYGRDFDFSRPFFEQFKELQMVVPRISLNIRNCQNTKYGNYEDDDKDCYLNFGGGFCERSFYGSVNISCTDTVDTHFADHCELCYEVIDCEKCYSSAWIQDCHSVRDSYFCYDLRNCSDCLFCFNLRGKQYCINNKQYSQKDYERELEKLNLGSYKSVELLKERFESMKKSQDHLYSVQVNSEDCTGNHLTNSKNAQYCFDGIGFHDTKYCFKGDTLKDSYDCDVAGWPAELMYECVGSYRNCRHHLFCFLCWDDSDLLYSDFCHYSSNLFGCISVMRKEYCILNKQYSREEYEELVPRIIEHMKKTPYEVPRLTRSQPSLRFGGQVARSGSDTKSESYEDFVSEWGEFFPMWCSPYAYNETVVQDYYPLSRDQVLSKGWNWYDGDESSGYQGPRYDVPDDIKDVPDDLCERVLQCEVTGKSYKVIQQELRFYRRMGLPIPRRCPDQRYQDRLALRNSRRLWKRECGECGKGIESSYSPEREERVLCEECYLKQLY